MHVISRFSTRFPKSIIAAVVCLTIFFAYSYNKYAYIEPDMQKFMPSDMKTSKANDYYRKNFSYNEMLIIGIEAPQTGIMNPKVLRKIEAVVSELKQLTSTKTVESHLTGQQEMIELPVGIDTEDITSISGLEDAILDKTTGAVVTGSVIAKLKKEVGIPYTDETEELLPELDTDLEKIIPALKQHIMNDRLFRGNILSEDGLATTMMVPMIGKWDYKQRFSRLELATAIDPQLLKNRFLGKESTFPHQVFGKTVNGETYDDAFIAEHTEEVREELKDHLEKYLSPAFQENPGIEALLEQELTAETFGKIMNITNDKEFFMHPDLQTWEVFTNKLYDFMLVNIDPLSYENLEFQLADVKQVYDLLYVYDSATEILDRHSGKELNFYIAGQPVVISVMSRIINKDMGLLMPIGILVIFSMLALSFRSVRGVIIPLVTVVLSVLWSIGLMALTGTPITTSTSIMPIVLLAVGSAYGIHFLNRYHEETRQKTDRKVILRLTIEGVGVAILMAGLTTFSGFASLYSSPLLLIKHFGLFTAFGVFVALVLTLTLTPALLSFWKLPGSQNKKVASEKSESGGFIQLLLLNWGRMVKSYPKRTLAVFTIVTIIAGVAMTNLEFEGGMMSDFKEDSPLKQSDKFINKNLTGTGEFNLVFKFRDRVNLENEQISAELNLRIAELNRVWRTTYSANDFTGKLIADLQIWSKNPSEHQDQLESSLTLLRDIFNEEYIVKVEADEPGAESESAALLDELMETDSEEPAADESETDDFSELGDLADSEELAEDSTQSGPFSDYSPEQIAGLKDINRRLNFPGESWEDTGLGVIGLRESKSEVRGQQVIKHLELVNDIFATDIKQPRVLHKLEKLRAELVAMEAPTVDFLGETRTPTGFLTSPVDLVRKTYSVFYHDENPAFKKIPDSERDGLADKTLTDRGIIGVVLNQAQNSDREMFESMVSADFKEFQVNIMSRDGKSAFIDPYSANIYALLDSIFPSDDPYIKDISIGGQSPVTAEIATLIATSQIRSILQAMVFVFFITFFIFRSAWGGLYSIIPLVFTIIANFGMMVLLGWKINTGTVMVASISIGIGVDYTIHFLERFKAQLKKGDQFDQAYFNTIQSVGKAILINATSVTAGFLVLLLSDLTSMQAMGLLMTGTMLYSTIAAITLLPAIIFVMKPRFLGRYNGTTTSSKLALKN